LSFTIQGLSPENAARALAKQGLFVSHGDYYASTVVERLGLQPDGMIRVGCSCYTDEAEIERLIVAVAELTKK
jgi:selenocysteine lyase/cysteine desulfurase